MQITMNTVFAGAHPTTGSPLTLQPGDVADFPAAYAKELIDGKFAFDHVAVEVAKSKELEEKRLAKLNVPAAATNDEEDFSGSKAANAASKPARRRK